jgi:hypothetical protein
VHIFPAVSGDSMCLYKGSTVGIFLLSQEVLDLNPIGGKKWCGYVAYSDVCQQEDKASACWQQPRDVLPRITKWKLYLADGGLNL